MNKPQLGDLVSFEDHNGDTHWGIVDNLLSSQFTIMTEQDITKFCFYKDTWRML